MPAHYLQLEHGKMDDLDNVMVFEELVNSYPLHRIQYLVVDNPLVTVMSKVVGDNFLFVIGLLNGGLDVKL
jgi:hypothetical protein